MAQSHCFSLNAAEGAAEEDDGFVDILESDLKVNRLGPEGPHLYLPGTVHKRKALRPFRKTVTAPQGQKENLSPGQMRGRSEKGQGLVPQWREGWEG